MSSRFKPYTVERQPDGSYSFQTDKKITYGVVFTWQDDLFSPYTHLSDLFFELILEVRDLAGHDFPPKDFRTGRTIAWILEQFFTSKPDSALTYTCEDADQKEHKRFLQFTRWFDNYNSDAIKLEKSDYAFDVVVDLTDEWGQTHRVRKVLYTSIMLLAGNPRRQTLLDAFDESLKEYKSDKS